MRRLGALAVFKPHGIGVGIVAGILHPPGAGLPRQFRGAFPVLALTFGIGRAFAVLGRADPADIAIDLCALRWIVGVGAV